MASTKMREFSWATRAQADRIIAACLPSLIDLFFIFVLFIVAFGLQGRVLGADGDAAWTLRIGSYVLDHGVPRTDFMLSTRLGQSTMYWEWLSQVAYALALRLGGLNGVVALAAMVVALTSALLFTSMRRRGVPLALALPLAVVATSLTSIIWTARSQLFSMLLLVLWSDWLWRYWRRGNQRLLWLFPASMALWANLHGAFILGLLLLGITTAVAWLFPTRRGQARPQPLAFALAGSLMAALLNPWGPALIAHVFGHASNSLIARLTEEFQSPNFHGLSMQIFLALVFALAGAWIWMGRQSVQGGPEPLAVAHGAVWTAIAFYSVRFVPVWALVMTPILGESLTVCLRDWLSAAPSGHATAVRLRRMGAAVAGRFRAFEATERLVGRGIWSVLALLLLIATVARGGAMPGSTARILDARFDPTTFPVAAAQRLHHDGLPAGRGFNTFAWGGYLDYALPEYHAFIDSRADVFSQRLVQDYVDIITLQPGWHELLDHYAVRWALLPVGEPLAQILALTPGWRCVAADGSGVAVLCQSLATP